MGSFLRDAMGLTSESLDKLLVVFGGLKLAIDRHVINECIIIAYRLLFLIKIKTSNPHLIQALQADHLF